MTPTMNQMASLMMQSPEVAQQFQQLFAGGVPRGITAQLAAQGPNINPAQIGGGGGGFGDMSGGAAGAAGLGAAAAGAKGGAGGPVNTPQESVDWYGSNASLYNDDGSVALPQNLSTGPGGSPPSVSPIQQNRIGPPTPGGMGGAPGQAPAPQMRPMPGTGGGTGQGITPPQGGAGGDWTPEGIRGLLDSLPEGPQFMSQNGAIRTSGPFDPAKFGDPGAAKAGDTTAEGIFKMFLGGMMGA